MTKKGLNHYNLGCHALCTAFYLLIGLVVISHLIGSKICSSVLASSNSGVSFIQNDYDLDKTKCIQSLLVNRHQIPDSAFNATSEVVDPSGAKRYSAHSIRNENTDFAWCPGKRIGTDCDEYVEIDMGELNIITKVVISGLLAEGGGSRYTPYFYIRYKREQNAENWRTYRQLRPIIISRLLGGLDALVPKFVVLDPPLIARWIRIYPYRDTPGFVCIRLEAYGCRFSDDLVEYRIPEGSLAQPPYQAETDLYQSQGAELFVHEKSNFSQAGGGLPFSDTCYDGHRIEPGSLLDGGLGCLIDLNSASRDTIPSIEQRLKVDKLVNYQFVGWHRDRWRSSQDRDNGVVDMLFRFASVRNFTRLRLYISNNYLEKIRLPRRLEVKFSVGGVHFSGQSPISRDFKLENRSLGVFSIIMDLSHRIGQVVQLKAFFADEWLLFSEIRFESDKVITPIQLDESAVIVTRSSNHQLINEEDSVNTKHQSDANKMLLSNDSVLDDSSTRLSTVVILVLVLLCCFLGLLAGVACFSVTWMHRKRHDLEREKHQVHKTLLIRGEDGLNACTTSLRGNGDVSPNTYTAVRPNMHPFILSGAERETGVSTVLPNGGLQSYHQLVLSPNTNMETQKGGSNEKNPSQQYRTSQPNAGIIIGQSDTIVNRLSGGTVGPSDGVTSETEAFCDNKHDDETHPNSYCLSSYNHDYRHHISKQYSSVLSSLLCISKMKKRRKQNSLKITKNNIITRLDHSTNVHGNINSKEIEPTSYKNVIPHTEFLNTVNDFPIIAQVARSQSGHDLGLRSTDLLNAHLRGQTSVQAANGLLQIDLSRGHPSMLINGRPLMRISAPSNQPDIAENSWLMHTGYHNNNVVCSSSFGMNLVNSEPGVYTTVGGAESDADSNGASTMSPEYASTSILHDYPMLAATLAQLNQQRLSALSPKNIQPNIYPCTNPLNSGLSSSASVNFNVLINPPLNSPFDNSSSNVANSPSAYGNGNRMNNFLTSVNSIQQPLLFSNPHSMHDMMMLTTSAVSTTATTKMLDGLQSSYAGLTETNGDNNYGETNVFQNLFQHKYQQQNSQIYEAYNLPTPSAPIYYPTSHQIISPAIGQYFPCVTSTQLSGLMPISSPTELQSMLPSSIANRNDNTISDNSTLVGRGYDSNECKSLEHVELEIEQSCKRPDLNKSNFNVKSSLATINCLPKSHYRVSDHNPWIKASNLNRYETEQAQRRQHENMLPPTPSSPPPPLPPSS
ncbi:Discoidin domain-containing receptor 2 [Schistosoma japonicum]|nr:Discoidin domain-containing receptor 2 [Schistosoma japonicum]